MILTKKQYDVLLYLRKKPRTLEKIKEKFDPKDDWELDYLLLPTHGDLYERVKDKKGREAVKLTDEGVTYAQAEYDRRVDTRCTRVTALIAIGISAAALILQAIEIVLELLPPQ